MRSCGRCRTRACAACSRSPATTSCRSSMRRSMPASRWCTPGHGGPAVFMADAWGRLTGEPGVALVTGGPGHANAVGALYTAAMAESPVVLLSGHAPNSQLGTGAFQEMRQAEIAAPLTKLSFTSASADD